MKKTLNTADIANELRGGSSFFQPSSTPSIKGSQPSNLEAADQPVTQSVDQSTNQSTIVSTTQPLTKSVVKPIGHVNDSPVKKPIDSSPILGRPKAFYITKKQDDDLDKAVKMLAEKVEGRVVQKIDRSTILRLILEDDEITTKETIDRLTSRLTSRLISQLTN